MPPPALSGAGGAAGRVTLVDERLEVGRFVRVPAAQGRADAHAAPLLRDQPQGRLVAALFTSRSSSDSGRLAWGGLAGGVPVEVRE